MKYEYDEKWFNENFIEEEIEYDILDENVDDIEFEVYLEVGGLDPIRVAKNKKRYKGYLYVRVGDNEKSIQHFHIFRSKTDVRAWKHGICLMYMKNAYFDHAENREVLTKDEFDVLMEVLKSSYKGDKDVTCWDHLVYLWNENNPKFKLPNDLDMPNYDYYTIKRYKERNIKNA